MKKILYVALLLICSTSIVLTGCDTQGGQTPLLASATETPTETAAVAEVSPTVAPSFAPIFAREEYPRVDGSTATIPLAVEVLSRTCAMPIEEAELYVSHSRTNEAYNNLCNGYADILLAYEAPESAKRWAESSDFKWIAEPIGRDALVFLVNEDNPVESLTEKQIQDIYSGKITNWKEVGGNDVEIAAFQRDESSGSQTLMDKLVMRGLKMADAPASYIPAEMGDLIKKLAAYDNSANAIGYSVYYYVNSMFQMPGIKMIAVEGVQPSDDTIGSGQYPYLNDFYVVIDEEAQPGSPERKLFDYMLSPDGEAVVTDCGYVPVKR